MTAILLPCCPNIAFARTLFAHTPPQPDDQLLSLQHDISPNRSQRRIWACML